VNDNLAQRVGAKEAFDHITEPKKSAIVLTIDFDKIADPFVMPGDMLCAATPSAATVMPPAEWTKNQEDRGWTLWYHMASGRAPHVFLRSFYPAIDIPSCPYAVLRPNYTFDPDE
jgi:hypothetical protein